MARSKTRRQFLKTTAATGIGFWVAGGVQVARSQSPNEQIGMASVGIGGKGSSDSNDAAHRGRMVAICDTDKQRLEGAARKFAGAKPYTDFRKMLEEMEKSIDAVSIYEARLMGRVAREKKLATQMGNQGTAGGGLRKAAALLRKGILGKVTEVHVWTNRPIWPQGGERPAPKDPPPHLEWNLWLGPAPERPYADGYHPFSWRGWWDFGTGALGDMACHTVNLPYMGLELKDPVSVQAETSGHNRDSYPKWSVITYEFPANDKRGPLKMIWYDGGKKPDPDLLDGEKLSASGSLVVGEKGKLYSPGDYGGRYKLLGGAEEVEVEFPQSSGHFQEWVDAIRGGKPAMSNFPDYASSLTEIVLLGNLAVWVANEPGLGEKVEWDAKQLKAKNVPGLETIVKPVYRKGYTLDA